MSPTEDSLYFGEYVRLRYLKSSSTNVSLNNFHSANVFINHFFSGCTSWILTLNVMCPTFIIPLGFISGSWLTSGQIKYTDIHNAGHVRKGIATRLEKIKTTSGQW